MGRLILRAVKTTLANVVLGLYCISQTTVVVLTESELTCKFY